MKRIDSMLLTGCLLIFMGCANDPGKLGTNVSDTEIQVTGRYMNPMISTIYIELKEGGIYYDQFGKRFSRGKYVVAGNRVTVTLESGRTLEFVIEGNTLVTKEGGRLTRQ